ncbi:CST complex subunit TEN1 isoform X1 [Acipenser ruthenus]|uniref:CST complex subunit TEN1 isoform X1 n=1 Tax=Acipenser ruthenus TaxID=7906 RepID=UPI0027418BEA|nr:CST complex subunit TEN1 isoform X1 [Acipenser ruthenus]
MNSVDIRTSRGGEKRYSQQQISVKMLPAPGVFHFLWEITSGAVQEGATVRTIGRLACYRLEDSEVTLTLRHGSAQHQLVVLTGFVEPFLPITGALYMTLGECESRGADGDTVLRARVLTCVEGVNLPQLEHAVSEQRRFFQEREGGTPTPHTTTGGPC